MFCGYRILPGGLLLSRRRKRRYAECRRDWESAYSKGLIDERTLQAGYASAPAIIAHADAGSWRREPLRRCSFDGFLAMEIAKVSPVGWAKRSVLIDASS